MAQTSYRFVRIARRADKVEDGRSKQLLHARGSAARNDILVLDADPTATKPAPAPRRNDRP